MDKQQAIPVHVHPLRPKGNTLSVVDI